MSNNKSKAYYLKNKNKFECKKCDRFYSSKQALQRHTKSKKHLDGKKPEKIFRCEECNKTFKSRAAEVYHKNVSKRHN